MSGVFLYFVPNVVPDGITREWLRSSPLADLFRDVGRTAASFCKLTATREAIHGPAGATGTIIAAGLPDGQKFGYYPEQQEWIDLGTHWLGIDKERRPTPDTLKRVRIFDGYEIELNDGDVWIAPTIRPWHDEQGKSDCALPMVWGLSGSPAMRTLLVQDLFRGFWALSGDLIDYYAGKVSRTVGQCHDDAVRCLGLNYRLGSQEADWLQLFDTDLDQAVWRAAIDAELIDEWIRRQRDGTAADPT